MHEIPEIQKTVAEGKKEYRRPELTVHGDMLALTQDISGIGNFDNAPTNDHYTHG